MIASSVSRVHGYCTRIEGCVSPVESFFFGSSMLHRSPVSRSTDIDEMQQQRKRLEALFVAHPKNTNRGK
jgi:hypothetical protein